MPSCGAEAVTTERGLGAAPATGRPFPATLHRARQLPSRSVTEQSNREQTPQVCFGAAGVRVNKRGVAPSLSPRGSRQRGQRSAHSSGHHCPVSPLQGLLMQRLLQNHVVCTRAPSPPRPAVGAAASWRWPGKPQSPQWHAHTPRSLEQGQLAAPGTGQALHVPT